MVRNLVLLYLKNEVRKMGDNKAKVIIAIEDLLFISKITPMLQKYQISDDR